MKHINWENLKFLVIIARSKTLRRAAKKTGVSTATLARRMDELEYELGIKLLERVQSGCMPTAAGMQIIAWAEQMEEISFEIERTRDQQTLHAAKGIVKINTDELISYFLTSRFSEFHALYPHVEIEIITSHRPYSLTRREADIAIRNFRPEQADLIIQKIGTLSYGLYCSQKYYKCHQTDIDRQAWDKLDFVGFDEHRHHFHTERWLRSLPNAPLPWMRCSYALGIFDGITHDNGLGLLDNFIAAETSHLLYSVIKHIPELDQEIWLSTHSGLRSSARINVVKAYIRNLFTQK
ncbi:LysR family transcriptional regulator [Commensalibacter oyaizuii]|uniref:LysR family transcriptional regulator n=1 Tax=Commensalibacter oyaizuii TaxID=3043873 RepID=A0ABT6Q324_9PROT|nr:LysR family transcriptional regulator [Commensalibacter sp. TBRC 16381]MDI2091535.1 LysR family transcriptional regulator [Commensalibacter sp. TBRC 16381]